MPNPRGVLTAEGVEQEIREAKVELDACTTIDELRTWWRKHFGRLGHKPLARLFLGMDIETVIAKRAGAENPKKLQ